MKPTERSITLLLRSRLGAYSLVAVATIAVMIASSVASLPAIATGRGLVTGAASADFLSATASFGIALLAIGATMGAMVVINNSFNLLRTSSPLYIGVLAFMEAASPLISTRACSGILVSLIVLISMGLIYTVYQQPVSGTKRVFLVFSLLSAGSMFQYALVAYLPVFLAGCAQMRCFTFRTFLAALVGIAVPWWIGWGFGWIDLSKIAFPTDFSIFTQLDISDTAQLVAVIAVTVIVGFVMTLTNMVKVYSYNARARSLTGLLVTVTIATLMLAMIDFANITAYLPLLNCCVAYQTALFFRIKAENRGYIAVCTILSLYLILYVWALLA
ncbi:MAG: hypothetical protein K2G01_09455 [Paramuribaculum sp.]|nr:hypothetical protein [Paramuribaculum sp.]